MEGESKSMNIYELKPYIEGKLHFQPTFKRKPKYLTDIDLIKYWEIIKLADNSIDDIENSKEFFSLEKDIAHEIPPQKREEVFYTFKLDIATPIFSSKALYLLLKTKEKYVTINNMCKALPETLVYNMLSEGFITGNYSLLQIINSLVDKDYIPMDETFKVKHGDFYDIYIPSEETVAVVNKDIANSLSYEDICKIKLTENKLTIDNVGLIERIGGLGIGCSTYDLRRII